MDKTLGEYGELAAWLRKQAKPWNGAVNYFDEAATAIQTLVAQQQLDAQTISRLNSGEELQDLCRRNNELLAERDALRKKVAGLEARVEELDSELWAING